MQGLRVGCAMPSAWLTCGSLRAKERHKGGGVPSKKRESEKKNNLAAEQKIMQPVVRTVRESTWVRCYLACGHMITVRQEDLKEPSSSSRIECWACEEERKEGLSPK